MVEGGNEVNVVAPSTYHTSMSLPASTSRTACEVGGGGEACGDLGGMAVQACIAHDVAQCDPVVDAGLIVAAHVMQSTT